MRNWVSKDARTLVVDEKQLEEGDEMSVRTQHRGEACVLYIRAGGCMVQVKRLSGTAPFGGTVATAVSAKN